MMKNIVVLMSVLNAIFMSTICWLAYKFDKATLGNINIGVAVIASFALCLLPIYVYQESRQFDEFLDQIIQGYYERSTGNVGRVIAHFGWVILLVGNLIMFKQIIAKIAI